MYAIVWRPVMATVSRKNGHQTSVTTQVTVITCHYEQKSTKICKVLFEKVVIQ